MSIQIMFELEDEDLEHFRVIMKRARRAAKGLSFEQIIEAAQNMIQKHRGTAKPKFVAERLAGTEGIINMVLDKDWQLPEQERKRVAHVLAYFCEPEDLIPDHIPGIGLLDDAIMMELMIRELKPELDAHQNFCAFRDRELEKRQSQDASAAVTRADWLDAKRAELHKQARVKRSALPGSGNSLFSFF